jgi:midasin (ATPase involved in ribosome maturation)
VAWSSHASSHLRARLSHSPTYNASAPAHLNTTTGVVHAAFGGVVAMAYPDGEGRVPLSDRARASGLLALSPVNSTQTNVARILFALESDSPVMLTSAPGVGKTKTAQVVGELITGLPLCRISFSAETSVESLFGQIMPSSLPITVLNPFTGLNETRYLRQFVWRDGPITTAIRSGTFPPLMLWDEVNLAPPEVLDALAPLLARDRHLFRIPGQCHWTR